MATQKRYKLEEPLNSHMGYYFQSSRLLYSKQTAYQFLEIHEVPEYGRVLRLDGILQTSEKDEFLYHEILTHLPAITMNVPGKALLIGGGDGGSVEELLKYASIEKVVMVELDEMVVEKSKEFLPGISNQAFQSDRLELQILNGIQYIEQTREKFDQVVLDLTDAFGPSLGLYTKEFYEKVRRAMNPRGILSLHIESPVTMNTNFRRIYHTLRSVFKFVRPMLNYIPLYGTLWGFAAASDHYDPSEITREVIQKRLKENQIKDLKFYNEETHHSVQCIPPYIQEALGKPAEPITEENKHLVSAATAD